MSLYQLFIFVNSILYFITKQLFIFVNKFSYFITKQSFIIISGIVDNYIISILMFYSFFTMYIEIWLNKIISNKYFWELIFFLEILKNERKRKFENTDLLFKRKKKKINWSPCQQLFLHLLWIYAWLQNIYCHFITGYF